MDGSIATVKQALRERRDALVTALGARAARGALRRRREGGYFMWVELPEGVDVDALFDRRRASAASRSSRARTSCSRAGENTLRLAYSGVTPEQIDEGIARLADGVPRSLRHACAA